MLGRVHSHFNLQDVCSASTKAETTSLHLNKSCKAVITTTAYASHALHVHDLLSLPNIPAHATWSHREPQYARL